MQKKKERAVEFGFCCKKSFKTQKGRSRHKKNIKTRCFMQDRKKNQNANVTFYFKSITVHAIELCQS